MVFTKKSGLSLVFLSVPEKEKEVNRPVDYKKWKMDQIIEDRFHFIQRFKKIFFLDCTRQRSGTL